MTAEFDSFYLISGYVPNSGDGLRRLVFDTKHLALLVVLFHSISSHHSNYFFPFRTLLGLIALLSFVVIQGHTMGYIPQQLHESKFFFGCFVTHNLLYVN